MNLLAALGLESPRDVLQDSANGGPTAPGGSSDADLFAAAFPVLGGSEGVGETGLPGGSLVAGLTPLERRFFDLTRQGSFLHNPLAPERGRGSVPSRDDLESFVRNSLTGTVARGGLGGIGNCYEMSATLAAELDVHGINFRRIVNQGTSYGSGGGEDGPGFGHAYLKVTTPGQELIVDPTIGQFFNQRGSPTPGGGWSNTPSVFIGTRAELIQAYERNMSRAGQAVKDMGAEAFVNAIYGPPDAQSVQQMRPLDRNLIQQFQRLRQEFERAR